MSTAPAIFQPEQRSWPRRMAGRVVRPIKRRAWEYAQMAKHGRPQTVLTYGNGFGDHLLCTAVFRELRKRGGRGLWMMSGHNSLFGHNHDVDAVVPVDWRYPELVQRIGGRSVFPDYATIVESEDRSTPPDRHIIACMCQRTGITGPVELRPYLTLTDAEKAKGRLAPKQITIQSSILSAKMPIRNKEWIAGRFQQVVDALKSEYAFIQIGSDQDPTMAGAIDIRGKTSIRETAAVMSQSLVFVGLVGFLMHLARAVDCRAAIVFGGREAPWQSGYSTNENLYSAVPCAPCWYWSKCDHDHQCMKQIEAPALIEAIKRQVARDGTPLPVAIDTIEAEVEAGPKRESTPLNVIQNQNN